MKKHGLGEMFIAMENAAKLLSSCSASFQYLLKTHFGVKFYYGNGLRRKTSALFSILIRFLQTMLIFFIRRARRLTETWSSQKRCDVEITMEENIVEF
jgi:hypothetical protein